MESFWHICVCNKTMVGRILHRHCWVQVLDPNRLGRGAQSSCRRGQDISRAGVKMNSEILVEQFCTPSAYEEIEFDRKAFAEAKIEDVKFEERKLRSYSMGKGKNVLLVHGWSSRASHM